MIDSGTGGGGSRLRPLKGRGYRWLVFAALIVDVIVALPVIFTTSDTIGSGWKEIHSVIFQPKTLSLIEQTVVIAAFVTPICGVIGTATAWCVERTNLPGKKLWSMLIVAPLTIPLFVTSYAWAALGPATSGFWGAIAIISLTYSPIVYLLVTVSFRGLDPAIEESARSLGCSPWRNFWRVILPQIWPAIVGGMLIIALDSLVEFDALVALKVQTFSTAIFAQYQAGASVAGVAILSSVSVAICVAVLVIENWLRRGRRWTGVNSLSKRAPIRYPLGPWMAAVVVFLSVIVVASIGIPVWILGTWIYDARDTALTVLSVTAQYVPGATWTSVWTGAVSSLLAVMFAMPIALIIVRGRTILSVTLERVTYLSFALPDMVAAIAITFLASHALGPGYDAYSLPLILSYTILYVPMAVIALRATMEQIEPRYADVARSLGNGGWATWWKITVPLSKAGIAAALVLVFAFVLGDLATAQLLLPPGAVNLGTEFWANSTTEDFVAASPYAGILLLLAMLSTYILISRFGAVSTARFRWRRRRSLL